GPRSKSPRVRTSSASNACACQCSCRTEEGGVVGTDGVELDIPGFPGKLAVDLLEGEPGACQQGWSGPRMPEREAAIVPAAAHAQPVAARIEADQRNDDEVQCRRLEQGAAVDHRFGDAEAVGS